MCGLRQKPGHVARYKKEDTITLSGFTFNIFFMENPWPAFFLIIPKCVNRIQVCYTYQFVNDGDEEHCE